MKRKKFYLSSFIEDHVNIFKSSEFICYTLIVSFPFVAMVIYTANLSVIMINHLGFNLAQFSYYQATTMGTFIIFSLLSIKMIQKHGLDKTKDWGTLLSLFGALFLLIITYFDKTNINLICISMAFIAAGGALMAGPYGMKTLALFPNMKGTSMGVMMSFRQFLIAGLLVLTEFFFDGTIVPITLIIFAYALMAIFCLYLMRTKI